MIQKFSPLFALTFFCFLLLLFFFQPAFSEVRVVQLPDDVLVPEAAADSSGLLHVVYGKGDGVFYVRSADRGKSFEAPIQLSRPNSTAVVGGERGPRISIGKENFIYVVWLNKKEGGVGYARSVNGGKSFEVKDNIVEAINGKRPTDSPDVSADQSGKVCIVWLDGRLPADPNSPVSSSIFISVSYDSGETFSANIPLESDYPGKACACCALESKIDSSGEIYVAFRGGYQNIRDMHLLTKAKGEGQKAKFKSALISDDRWKYEACPMSGAFLSLNPDGKIYVAWMNQGEVSYALSSDGGQSFQSPVRPKGISQSRRNHPVVLVNSKEEVFFAWMENAKVKWEIRSSAGQVISSGDAGEISPRSKPTGFVDRDDSFVLVR